MGATRRRAVVARDFVRRFRLHRSKGLGQFAGRTFIGSAVRGDRLRLRWRRALRIVRLSAGTLPGRRIRKVLGNAARAAEDAAHQGLKVLRRAIQRPAARHRVWIVEVPRILRKAYEVADDRIGAPGAAKRRTAQFLGTTLAQERRAVANLVDPI